MKHFKFSFMAITAILAIALTFATKTNAFSAKAAPFVCQSDATFLVYGSVSGASTNYYNPATGVPVEPSEACPDEAVTPLNLALIPPTCETDIAPLFCCAKVHRTTGAITVFCRPIPE